jgi:hypothetical protein
MSIKYLSFCRPQTKDCITGSVPTENLPTINHEVPKAERRILNLYEDQINNRQASNYTRLVQWLARWLVCPVLNLPVIQNAIKIKRMISKFSIQGRVQPASASRVKFQPRVGLVLGLKMLMHVMEGRLWSWFLFSLAGTYSISTPGWKLSM